jgi:UPF0716 protein FxsA
MPQREIQDGVAVIFGGAFLITPGFLTDIFGLLLLLPPTRTVILRLAARRIAKRMTGHITVSDGRARHDYDVEGTATERPPAEPPHLQR